MARHPSAFELGMIALQVPGMVALLGFSPRPKRTARMIVFSVILILILTITRRNSVLLR
jgi:hypothetical protein